MLEKIGLPPKPTLRGNNWVADASHCQGCSSQFTFINRKHHCRRCGGLFCNSCTSQRMVLRGQGDSPVRICEPCKKLEEASRFEMRYGHKSRSGKGGGSKLTTKSEDEVLNQILGNDGKSSMSSMSSLSSDQDPTNGASGSTLSQGERGAIHRSMSSDQQPTDVSTSVINTTPEELRQQAVEEKKKHRSLKAEGKPEEALRAFKRGKELEREAAALEISLRKNRRKALSESISNTTEVSNVRIDAKVPSLENKHPPKKKENDDLAAELRELGWSDMDLHDADDKKPVKTTLEGELSKLLGEVSQGARTENGIRGAHGIDKSQVNAHKRKALELKRQGKLAEAKEELKKAKVLEKQIEEQELLGEDEDEESDEEFSSLLRSLNTDKHEDLSIGFDLDQGFDIGNIGGLGEDLGADDDLEITRADMHDPDILAALQSIGWTEDTDAEDFDNQLEGAATEASANEIQSIKKEALKQKRAGNSKEALALFRKAKLLEKELESASGKTSSITDNFAIPSESLEADVEIVHERKNPSQSKSKSAIQRELLGLKKRALALRREGKLNEAEEELKKGKVLEKQLEELETAPRVRPSSSRDKEIDESMVTDVGDEDVTDQDMTDPSYLAVLKSLGFSDDANESHPPSSSEHHDGPSVHANVQASVSRKSKSEIQRELLGLKRKLLVLRRQGETEEAEEMLKKAEVLESQLAEMEASTQNKLPAEQNAQSSSMAGHDQSSELNATTQSPLVDLSFITPDKQKQMVHRESVSESQQYDGPPPLQQDILAHKRMALALKREGKLAEAKEELRRAKLLEKRLEESKSQDNESQSSPSPNPSPNELSGSSDVSHDVGKKDSSPDSAPKTLSSRERFKLQQESLNHKRQALKLRREGRTEEADAEFEKAKAIEAQLEESSPQKAAEPVDDVGVEDFLDPQLFSALKAIGLDNVGSGSGSGSGSSQLPEKHEPAKQVDVKIESSSDEKVQLENQIKAEKVKALNFKRSGKQAEALDALRKARVLEKKLNSLVK